MSRLLKTFIFFYIFSLICFQPVSAQFVPQNSPSYLTDYLETDVFLKLAPKIMQDRFKNAMIMRAGPNPNPETIKNLYGFTPATIQIHDYQIGAFKLSQLQPKPLDDPGALTAWKQSSTAQIWQDVPMFTREDTKGFIEAPSTPGQTTTPAFTEAVHPHLARTYEVSSALSLLIPYQKELKPIANSNSQSITKFITGTGDLAKDSNFLTIVHQTVTNPYYDPAATAKVTDKCGTHSACEKCDPKAPDGIDDSDCFVTATGTFIPSITFKTYTPFLNQISLNLIGQETGVFNLLNIGLPFPPDFPALGRDQNPPPNQAKFYYSFLGSVDCARQKVLSFLQPFTGISYNPSPECSGIGDDIGGDDDNNGDSDNFQCDNEDTPPPQPTNIKFSADGKYAFPLAPVVGYGCNHWGNALAVDLFVNDYATDLPKNLPVIAYTNGDIIYKSENDEYGGKNLILKGSDGRAYYYAHNCALYVDVGSHVNVGDVIATTNQTGLNAQVTPEHLHFAMIEGAGSNPYFQSGGGNICPQTDFEQKFNLGACTPTQQCTLNL